MESLEEWLTRPEGMATRLRALRVQAGMSGKELADANGWAQSKVSRIETGKQMPSAGDIEAWTAAVGAAADVVQELLALQEEGRIVNVTFRDRMRRGQLAVQQSQNKLVEEARLVRDFETAFIPGLLQVPDYTRRVLVEMIGLHGVQVDDVDAAVAARMQRQQMLYDPGKSFEFLITEPVLRWLLCPAPVMRAQLDRLQTVIGLEQVRFGIIPMGVELRWTPQNSVQMYVGEESVAAVETLIGQTFHRGDEAEAYGRALDLLWEEAVTGDQARDLIIEATRGIDLRWVSESGEVMIGQVKHQGRGSVPP